MLYISDEEYVPGEKLEYGCPYCEQPISPVDPANRNGSWQHTDLGVICPEGDEQDSPICRIEFLLARDDGTWTTETFEVPGILFHDDCTDDDRIGWVTRVHGENYPNVVLWAVYCDSPG